MSILDTSHMGSNYEKILSLLDSLKISFKEIGHPESHTCDESKSFRDAQWLDGIGSKNIIFHCKGKFYLVTTTGEKSIKARNFKHEFGSKDIRFASQDEITPLLQSTIWSIPPFGFENNTIPMFIDEEIFSHEFFIFNPSIPTKSIQIATEDLKKIYDSLLNPIKYFIHEEEKFELHDSL